MDIEIEILNDMCRICLKQDETVMNSIDDWIEIMQNISHTDVSIYSYRGLSYILLRGKMMKFFFFRLQLIQNFLKKSVMIAHISLLQQMIFGI